MRKIIITAGGTQEPIDKVRSITNKSSGKLGAIIAEKFLELDDTCEIIYIHGKNAVPIEMNTFNKERVKYCQVETTNDLEEAVKMYLTEDTIDIFVHTMAVADYYVEKVVDMSILEQMI